MDSAARRDEEDTDVKYSFNSRVRYSEVDENRRLSLMGLINYLQDCSTFQSEDLGVGIDYLAEQSRAWLLNFWQIAVCRYPELGEQITVSTWSRGGKGLYGYRNFTIADETGAYLVKANSIWFYYDTRLNRPTRVTPEDLAVYGQEPDLDMEYASRKIELPDSYREAEPMVVGRHQIDTNHHVNNAQYVAMACEVLPEDFVVGELRVEYKKAAVLGNTVVPRISDTAEGSTVALCDEEGQPYAVVWLKQMES